MIYKGELKRVSSGVSNLKTGDNIYEFIEIGDKRVRKVVVNDYMDNFLSDSIGKYTELALHKKLLPNHYKLLGIKDEQGRIEKPSSFPPIMIVVRALRNFLLAIPFSFAISYFLLMAFGIGGKGYGNSGFSGVTLLVIIILTVWRTYRYGKALNELK